MAEEWVVRLGRRRTSWELADARAIAQVEFQDHSTGGLDLRPSVYVLKADASALPELALRARTEHSVSFLSPPTGGFAPGDLRAEGLGATSVASPGNTRFEFTTEVHAELHLPDEMALLHLVDALKTDFVRRHLPTSQAQVLAFIAARLDAKDAEWERVLNGDEKKLGDWRRLVEKHRRQS